MSRASIRELLFEESTNEAIRAALPDPAITTFEVLTHLGDGPTLVFVIALLYWFGAPSRQQTRALVLAIGLLALAISAGVKGVVAAPRPDVAFSYATYSPYSFPSAHALGSAAVYGSLAVFGEIGTKRARYSIAGAVIVLVSLSRVVIGAHFLGDVIAGAAIGIAIVAALSWYRPDPGPVFAVSGVITVVSFAFGSTHYTTITTGAAIGAVVAWQYVGTRSWTPAGASLLLLALCYLPLLAVVHLLTVGWDSHWIVDVAGYAVLMGGAVLAPAVGTHLNDWSIVGRLQSVVPFSGRTIDPDQFPRFRD